jgi:hypothetical protein
VLLHRRPPPSPSPGPTGNLSHFHTEPYLPLVVPSDGGTRQLGTAHCTRGTRARPRLHPGLGAHLNVRPRPEPRARTYRRLGGRRAAFWRGAQQQWAQLAGRLRSGGAVRFAPRTPPPRTQPHPSARRAVPAELSPAAPARGGSGRPQQTPIMGSQSSKAPRGDVTAEEAAGASPAKANGQVSALGAADPGPQPAGLAPSGAQGRGRALCPARDTRRPLPRPVPLFSAPQPPRANEGRGGRGRRPGSSPSLFAPGPRALPPGRPEGRAGTKALLGRTKGASRAVGMVLGAQGAPSGAPIPAARGGF